MPKQRPELHVVLTLEAVPYVGARPLRPRRWIDGMRGRSEREHIEQHAFVVAAPAADVEPACVLIGGRLGAPSHVDERFAVARPAPVGAPIQRVGQRAHLAVSRVVTVKVLATCQRAGEQQRRVDRRKFDAIEPAARFHVEKVVEEAVVTCDSSGFRALWCGPEESQRREHAFTRRIARDPPMRDADWVRREGESHRGHARERLGRPSVRRQSVPGVRRLPEKIERALRQGVEKRRFTVRCAIRGRRRLHRRDRLRWRSGTRHTGDDGAHRHHRRCQRAAHARNFAREPCDAVRNRTAHRAGGVVRPQ